MSETAAEKSPERKTRQRTVAVPDELWDDVLRIAKARGERDVIGWGLPVVIRRELARYRERHRHLLAEGGEAAEVTERR